MSAGTVAKKSPYVSAVAPRWIAENRYLAGMFQALGIRFYG